MWTIKQSDVYERQLKWYLKKHPRETKVVHDNFDTFLGALNAGSHSRNVKAGYVHPEPGGVLAITERGAGKNAIPLRLYLYPDDEKETLYLITLGDKKSQNDDIIQTCRSALKFLTSESTGPHVQQE